MPESTVSRRHTGATIARVALPLLAAAALAAGAVPAEAAVVFDNGPAVIWSPPINPISDHDYPAEVADDFTLAAGATTIRGVTWTGDYGLAGISAPPANDTFAIRILADAAGLPAEAAPLYDFTVTNFIRTVSAAIPSRFDFFAGIPTTALTAGTTYWLSIVNITEPASFNSATFSWSINGLGNSAARTPISTFPDWNGFVYNGDALGVAFQLLDEAPATVPAPSGLAVLAGTFLFGFRRRRRAGGPREIRLAGGA